MFVVAAKRKRRDESWWGKRLRERPPILPLARVYLFGKRWYRWLPKLERRDDNTRIRRAWDYDVAEDVFELVCEEVRPGIYAEWADARERIA